jgi:CheY-like chemotaxis protein
VDDNATSLSILKLQLQQWKTIVTAVCSGKEALEMIADKRDIDLIITDMLMPDMDGVNLIKQIKALLINCPVVLLSSFGNDSKKLYPHLFNAVLTKPVKQLH